MITLAIPTLQHLLEDFVHLVHPVISCLEDLLLANTSFSATWSFLSKTGRKHQKFGDKTPANTHPFQLDTLEHPLVGV